MMSPKLVSRSDLAVLGDRLRAAGQRVVFTNGCFDLLHVGHLRYLRQARALGDVLVVGLNADSSVRELKGAGRPLVPEEERAELLAGLECVDHVTIFAERTPEVTLYALRPHVHVKGGDYQADSLPEASLVRALGGEVVIVPFVPDRSTTELVRRLAGLLSPGAPEAAPRQTGALEP